MKVDIWSDVVCPWCYIGKRRFESALARFAHRDEVEVVWHSFELDPNAPRVREGDNAEHLAAKYGISVADARAMHARMTEAAAAEELQFRFDTTKAGNTFDAHRLLHLAHDKGVQGEVKERLLKGYFTDGEPIGEHDVLVRLATDAGLDADEARRVLDDGKRYADDVRTDERVAAELGIRGVPFFVIDQRYGVSGAQPADVLLEVLSRAWAEANPLVVVGGDGDACADGSCAV